MKVLVTGAGGMVGSHMVELLHNRGVNVLGTYYKPTTDIKELPREIPMLECDVCYYQNLESIVDNFLPDQIYHLAAQSYQTVSWNQPQAMMEANVTGTVNLYESIKAARKSFPGYDPIVVIACSSAEYGETLNQLCENSNENNVKVKETAALLPLHPYGVSKVAQALLAFQYFMNDKIRSIRVRIFNSTGTRKVNDVTSDFTYRAIEAEKSGKYELRVGNLETRRAILQKSREILVGHSRYLWNRQ